MLQEVISHKCPNCAAKIEFDIFTQNFTCRFCGSAFSKEQMEELYPTDKITEEFIKEAEEEPTEEQLRETELFEKQGNLHSCPSCGAEIITRKDDLPETIKHRLDVYHEQTQPLIDYYQTQNILKEVDGTLPLEEVFSAIIAILED